MYVKLLDITRRLSAAEKKAEKAREQYRSMDMRETTPTRRANASDKMIGDAWERDKLEDELHCELVNLGLTDPYPASYYLPREVTQGAGRGHTVRFMYTPPVPECVKQGGQHEITHP